MARIKSSNVALHSHDANSSRDRIGDSPLTSEGEWSDKYGDNNGFRQSGGGDDVEEREEDQVMEEDEDEVEEYDKSAEDEYERERMENIR